MGKKKKSAKDDQMTLAEAYVGFQIQLKEKEVEEFESEVKTLEEKNQRYNQRQEHLKEEQLGHIQTLLKQAKDQERELEHKEVVSKEQVEQALQDHWELEKTKEREIEELHSQLNDLEQTVLTAGREKQYWLDYKNVGSKEHAKQIRLLEQELLQMQKDFQEMADHMQRSLDATVNEINKQTEKQIDDKKHLASEQAIRHLDKQTRQEVKENDWLKREAQFYRNEVAVMEVSVQKLEQDNLELMSQLFECRLEDLKISRRVFLTQVAGLEIAEPGLLGEDLEKLELSDHSARAPSRPKSAILAAVEKKVFSLPENFEKEETPTESDSMDLGTFLYGRQDDFQQYLQLGPLELKLLSVVGRGLHIKPLESNIKGAIPEQKEWPVTCQMIKSAFS
ncbi:coiled-coil domain-containing protein 83-like [Huso huso]|uniref:Coiled-coil domain-containing protein 83-like n=1 Tax=Huso huso TaxID=61971 RepID=A0ABR0ZMT1_HUSHU|nr:coiled-coil domain-containing protein 83-like isoform X1 [Acipenser ruthenus]XP_058886896.1 coiled-coil domain-containing protein 83-like isoform X1 [Acipenser ruthenus]